MDTNTDTTNTNNGAAEVKVDAASNSEPVDTGQTSQTAQIPQTPRISYDDFKKVEIKIGKVLEASPVEGSEKLLKLIVDFSEAIPRQIISGIALKVPSPEYLVGKEFPFATNLEPRKIFGHESNGMIMAVSDTNDGFALLQTTSEVIPGSQVS